MNAHEIIQTARNGHFVTLKRADTGKLYSLTEMIVRYEKIDNDSLYTIETFIGRRDNGKQLFTENDPILLAYLDRMLGEQGFKVSSISNQEQEREQEQRAAIQQYLLDRQYFVTIEDNTSKHAIFSGLINVITGNVDSDRSVHWHYFGKQASRTVYYRCSKVSQTVYTW